MNQAEILLLELFLMFVGAKLLGGVFERLRQPSVVGEIIAGVLLGPSLLGLIYPNEVLGALAEMGAIAACLGLSLASIYVGMAAISGAFLAVSRVPGANGC